MHYLGESGVEGHSRRLGVLREVEVRGTPQLLFDDERLLQQLEAAGQEFVLDLDEVALAGVHLERLVDDVETEVVLDVLPSAVAVGDYA